MLKRIRKLTGVVLAIVMMLAMTNVVFAWTANAPINVPPYRGTNSATLAGSGTSIGGTSTIENTVAVTGSITITTLGYAYLDDGTQTDSYANTVTRYNTDSATASISKTCIESDYLIGYAEFLGRRYGAVRARR